MLKKIEKNWKLFEILTDADFAKEYNISRERARQLRRIRAPETNTHLLNKKKIEANKKLKQECIDAKILEYIKNNSSNINISEFLRIYGLNNDVVVCYNVKKIRFKEIADTHGIKISYFIGNNEFEHGTKCTSRRSSSNLCNCEIGKLSNTISQHCFKLRIKISDRIADYLANKYIELYNNDKSKYHKEFYNNVDKEILENNLANND